MKYLQMLITALIVSATSLSPAAAQDYPKMNLRLAHYIGAMTPQSKVDLWWAEQINTRSGGKIKIEFFWSEAIGKSTELLDLVASGGVDFASTSPAYYPQRLPYSAVTHIPLLLKDNKQAQIVQTDLMALPQLQEENKKNKVIPLLWHSLPTYHLLGTKPVRTIEDFKGLKVRSYGEIVPVMWKSLGAVGVNVLAPEIYEGLQRGNLDCAYAPMDFAYNYKLHEVAKYLIDINFGAISAWPIYVGAETWAKWPEPVRKLIEQVSKEAAERDREEVAAVALASVEAMKKAGVSVVAFQDTDKLRAAIPDLVEVWIANQAKRGDTENARVVAQFARDHSK